MGDEPGLGAAVASLIYRKEELRRKPLLFCDDPCRVIEEIVPAKILPADTDVRPEWADYIQRNILLRVITAKIAEVPVRSQKPKLDPDRDLELGLETLYSRPINVLRLIDSDRRTSRRRTHDLAVIGIIDRSRLDDKDRAPATVKCRGR